MLKACAQLHSKKRYQASEFKRADKPAGPRAAHDLVFHPWSTRTLPRPPERRSRGYRQLRRSGRASVSIRSGFHCHSDERLVN
jgi:hypothetical protein